MANRFDGHDEAVLTDIHDALVTLIDNDVLPTAEVTAAAEAELAEVSEACRNSDVAAPCEMCGYIRCTCNRTH